VLALPQGTGSGFIISGRRILTNAHNVANQNWVIVQRHGIPKKYPATVVAVGHECDLALISVEDDDFWVGTVALEFGQVPELQMSVVVVGFPTGGDNLCVTAGVVSRVDVHEYAHSGFSLLCVQIDAAVNAGNSGGPALCDDSSKVIGVAFQGREDAENVGYIIPSSVVHHFLSDIERNGVYSGFVTLGVTWSPLENCHLRAYVGIDSCELPEGLARSGVVVCKVDKTRHDPEVLQAGDTLLAVDGVSIADDSTIQFRVMERLPFAHLILQKHVGDPCEITILRDRKVTKRTVVLQSPKYLVPECVYDELPRYYICGGMVFVPLTLTYMLHEFGKRYYEKAPNVLLGAIDERFRSREGEEVVIFSQVYISAGIEFRPKICEPHTRCPADSCVGNLLRIRWYPQHQIRGIQWRTGAQSKAPSRTHRRMHRRIFGSLPTFPGRHAGWFRPLLTLPSCALLQVFQLSHTQTVVLRREEAMAAGPAILAQHSIAHHRSEVLVLSECVLACVSRFDNFVGTQVL